MDINGSDNSGTDHNDRNQGYRPTASYGAAGAARPSGARGSSGRGRPSGQGRLLAGATAAAVLVGGAAFGAVTMLTGSPAAAATGPTGQAAVLNTALTSANNPAATVGAATAGHRHGRHPLRRLRRLGGIDGQFTFETKTGPKTLAFERGTIQSVAGNNVVVRAKNGTTWTWTLVSDSVVREHGQQTTASALSTGEQVFVGGPIVSGARDARLIVIRTPHKNPTTPATTTPS